MPRTASVSIMRDATSRSFSGGLDVSDSELNLTSKFSVVLDNIVVGIDGSLEVRQGTKLFYDIAPLSNYVISNIQFFFQYIITIDTRGQLFSTDITGTTTAIWTPDIANALRPGLSIWPSGEEALFWEFNGELIVMNGRDKPLVITNALHVDYLADKATGSNVNVPIGNIGTGYANHFVIASDYMLNISERNASGTWLGDVAAVYVNQFDMRPYVPAGDTEILGLFPFKGYLLVSFREFIVPLTLVENATATPKLDITIASDSIMNNYGAVSPRVGQDLGDIQLTADIVGVASFSLATFTRVLSPDRPSRFVDPLLQPDINKLSTDTLHKGVFSVFDRRLSTYIVFIPNDAHDYQKYVTGYMYRYIDRLKIEAWSRITGWNWHSATRSAAGNVFYARHLDTKVFIQGDAKTNPIYADFVGEQETWSDDTIFTDRTGFTPVSDINNSGIPIDSTWELPWSDMRHRGMSKTMRYLIMDTEGNQEFKAQLFIDDKYRLITQGEAFTDLTFFSDGTGFIPESVLPLTPALETDFIAKDAGGYGTATYGSSPYGGGNNTRLRLLTLMPTKFNTFKLRFTASTKNKLKYVAITVLYQQGTIRRMP
jgi:hypothetical protein